MTSRTSSTDQWSSRSWEDDNRTHNTAGNRAYLSRGSRKIIYQSQNRSGYKSRVTRVLLYDHLYLMEFLKNRSCLGLWFVSGPFALCKAALFILSPKSVPKSTIHSMYCKHDVLFFPWSPLVMIVLVDWNIKMLFMALRAVHWCQRKLPHRRYM